METKRMKRCCLFALVVCLWTCSCHSACTNPPGIIVTPSTNQTVPINNDAVVTYRCNVDGNRIAEWEFRGIQVSVGSETSRLLAGRGINITTGDTDGEAIMTIDRAGRELYQNLDLRISCTALGLTQDDRLTIESSCEYYIRTYDIPNSPPNFKFNPFPNNVTRLVLTWEQPDNTLIDLGDPVTTTYTVAIAGPTFNRTVNTTETRYEFTDSLDTPCGMHTFTVTASNGAGTGAPDSIDETIPISPDINGLNEQLTVSRIIMTTNPTVEVTFPRAVACSPNFPLELYIVTVVGVVSTSFSANDPKIVGRELISLNMSSNFTLPNERYTLTVSACIFVTCRESNAIPFMTTDVQAATVTFFENNIFLTCSFASSTRAQGCAFIFTISDNNTETVTVPLAQGQTFMCTRVQNMENAYSSIEVVDWESDGSYGNVTITPDRDREVTGEEYMTATGCPLPTVPVEVIEGLPVGAIAGIVVAVLLLAAISIVVIIVIVIVAWKYGQESGVGVVGELLDGRDSPDAAPQPSEASGGPPPPNQLQPKFKFQLRPGRKGGEFVINKDMLTRLQEMMSRQNDDDVHYHFLVPEK